MKDVNDNELKIGDTVAFCQVGYSRLLVGTIKHFSPKGVTIIDNDDGKAINRSPKQVALLPQPIDTNCVASERIKSEPPETFTGMPTWMGA